MSIHPMMMSEVPTPEVATSVEISETAQAILMDDPFDLHEQDKRLRLGQRQKEYRLLLPAYRAGLHLRENAAAFERFVADSRWGDRKPRGRAAKDRDRAVLLVMKAVFGGDRARDQHASFLGRACGVLVDEGVQPEDLIAAIEMPRGENKRGGLVELAKLAAKKRVVDETTAAIPKATSEFVKVSDQVSTTFRGKMPREFFILIDENGIAMISSRADQITPFTLL